MWKAIITGGLIAMVVFLIGCNDGGSRELRLPDGVVTESEYRGSVRAGLLGLQGASLCVSLRGLSGGEAFEALANVQASAIIEPLLGVDISQFSEDELRERIALLEATEAQVEAIATASASSDGARAGRIIQDECARILND